MALSWYPHGHVVPISTTRSSPFSPPNHLHFKPPPLASAHFPTKPSHTPLISSAPDYQKWRASVSLFSAFFNKTKDVKLLKEELLDAIAPLERGAEASPEDQQFVDQILRKLEAASPIKEPLKSDLLNGKWELLYTTSSKLILKTQRPKILRPVKNYQAINVDTLRIQNMESWPFFNQVTANLTPLNARKVAVQFDYFKIAGLIPIKAPARAGGVQEITYLDEELRVSRVDPGNFFIFKMVDPSYRAPV